MEYVITFSNAFIYFSIVTFLHKLWGVRKCGIGRKWTCRWDLQPNWWAFSRNSTIESCRSYDVLWETYCWIIPWGYFTYGKEIYLSSVAIIGTSKLINSLLHRFWSIRSLYRSW